MEKNVGSFDRNIRLLTGSIFILIALFAPVGTGWQIGLGVVGVIALLTAITNF